LRRGNNTIVVNNENGYVNKWHIGTKH